MNENREASADETRSVRRRLVSWPLALLGLTALLLLAANTVSAWGRGDDGDRLEDIQEHAAHFVEHALDKIDATDEQSATIQAIVLETIDQLHAARGDRGDTREEVQQLLTAETIDRDAIETLRAEHLNRADEMSRLVSQRLADVLEVLTPDQRRQLEARFERRFRHHRRGGWH